MDPRKLGAEVANWLNANQPNKKEVPGKVVAAIGYFVLVWGHFDNRNLHSSASRDDVIVFINSRSMTDKFHREAEVHFEYFRKRYFTNGHRFSIDLLALAGEDYSIAQTIKDELSSAAPSGANILSALALISYQIRCNLTHGLKWQYQLADQYENLWHATHSLMKIMDYTELRAQSK